MDNMDYHLLLDLYETKNITKAAQRNFLSQPAITKRIKRIEEELGCDLMLRNQKGVVFTSAGERIIPFCRRALQTELEMRDAVNQDQGTIGGTLNISVSHNFANYRLPDILKTFRARFPAVAVNVSTGKSSQLYFKLMQDKLCVAILRGDYKWTSSRFLLSEEPMCLITGKENQGRSLAEYSYVGHNTDAGEAANIERWAAEKGVSLKTSLWVDDINGCKELVRRGLGWSILPRICLDDFDGSIENLSFLDGSRFTRCTYVVYHDAYAQLLQVREFLHVLEEYRKNYGDY